MIIWIQWVHTPDKSRYIYQRPLKYYINANARTSLHYYFVVAHTVPAFEHFATIPTSTAFYEPGFFSTSRQPFGDASNRRWLGNAWRRNWVFHNFASGSKCNKNDQLVVSNMFYFYPYLRNWLNLTNMFFRVVCNHELAMTSWLVYSWWRHAYWGSESTCFMMNDWWSHLLEDYVLFDGIWRLNASHGEQPFTHWTWGINQDKTVVSF